MTQRDAHWYRLLLGWIEAGLRRTTCDRLALRVMPLKLVRFPDSPEPGATAWATYEFSDRRWKGPDVEVGYELVVALRGEVDGLTILRRTVETLSALDRPPLPGGVVLDLLQGIEGLPDTLPHAIFVPSWFPNALEPLVEGGRRVEAVMIVPVTEGEVDLVRTSGFDALAARWERSLAVLIDPGRPSAA